MIESNHVSCKISDQRYKPVHEYVFNSQDKWIFKITKNGIVFNLEDFPGYIAQDFAYEFIKILEGNFDVTFKKREK